MLELMVMVMGIFVLLIVRMIGGLEHMEQEQIDIGRLTREPKIMTQKTLGPNVRTITLGNEKMESQDITIIICVQVNKDH